MGMLSSDGHREVTTEVCLYPSVDSDSLDKSKPARFSLGTPVHTVMTASQRLTSGREVAKQLFH